MCSCVSLCVAVRRWKWLVLCVRQHYQSMYIYISIEEDEYDGWIILYSVYIWMYICEKLWKKRYVCGGWISSDTLTSYQWVSMPIYYRLLVCNISVMLYLCKLTDHKCINDQWDNPQLMKNVNVNVQVNVTTVSVSNR